MTAIANHHDGAPARGHGFFAMSRAAAGFDSGGGALFPRRGALTEADRLLRARALLAAASPRCPYNLSGALVLEGIRTAARGGSGLRMPGRPGLGRCARRPPRRPAAGQCGTRCLYCDDFVRCSGCQEPLQLFGRAFRSLSFFVELSVPL